MNFLVSDASKLSIGARIFKVQLGPEILVKNDNFNKRISRIYPKLIIILNVS